MNPRTRMPILLATILPLLMVLGALYGSVTELRWLTT